MKFITARSLGWVTVVVLIIAAAGWYKGSFDLLRWLVSLVAIILALTTYYGKKNIWFLFFSVTAITFNPIIPLHFNFLIWRILDAVVAALIGFFLWHYYDYYGKGYRFEDYISSLFSTNHWIIVDKTRDFSKKFGRIVESDSNPDFTFRYLSSGKVLAVECKFRSYFYKGGIDWGRRKAGNYLEFSQKNNLPVFIIFGVGNTPQNPGRMFCIPLNKI